MKKNICIGLSLAVVLMCFWYYHSHYLSRKSFHCDTQQISVQVKAKNDIFLNAYSTVVFSSSKTGIIYITGSIKENDTRYLLDRNISFVVTPSEVKGGKNTQFTHEEVHPADNTPDKIWRNFLMPEIGHVEFHTEILPLLHNALLLRGLTNPFLICIKQY